MVYNESAFEIVSGPVGFKSIRTRKTRLTYLKLAFKKISFQIHSGLQTTKYRSYLTTHF